MAAFDTVYYDIFYLALCWALTLTTSTLLTTVGPLSAKNLGADNSLAAFTIGAFLFGAAFSSVPSGPLFSKYGRLTGFSVGCLCQVIGSMLGCAAMIYEQAYLVYCGCFAVGLGQGLGQFYRFSAVEIAPKAFKSKAITYVLSGGVIAAFLGPTTANYSINLIGHDYLGSYLIMGVIGILNQGMVMLVNFPTAEELRERDKMEDALLAVETSSIAGSEIITPPQKATSRPLKEIIYEPLFIISCAIATMAHTQMVMVMSNCAIAMDDEGYDFNTIARVMELHFAAMFLPGFTTGRMIESYGCFLIALAGAFVFAGSSFVFATGLDQWNFYLGMILIGYAWNLSFSAGTVMLTGSYRPCEATNVQAINDFILFSVAAVGSLVSGFIAAECGWYVLIYVVSGMMVFNLCLFVVAWELKTQIDAAAVDGQEDIFSETNKRSISVASIMSTSSSVSNYLEPRPHQGEDEYEKVRSLSVA